MAGKYAVPDFLREEQEKLKRKEQIARDLVKVLDTFRDAAETLRATAGEAAGLLDFSSSAVAANFGMTATEKRVAFDRNSTLVPGAGEEENEEEGNEEEETDAAATAEDEATAGEPADGEDHGTGEETAAASADGGWSAPRADAGGQEPTTAWQ